MDDEHFEAKVDVVVSNRFFGWIVALEWKIVIKGPESEDADKWIN